MRCCFWIEEYVNGTGNQLIVENVPELLSFCRYRNVLDPTWPFNNDSLDELDAMREALKTVKTHAYVYMNLESMGLGYYYIPDKIPYLIRKEGLGLRDAIIRVFG